MKKNTAILVLILFVLVTYYPVIFAGVNSLDDFRMLDQLPGSGTLNLLSLFNPLNVHGYFRPLIILSYYFDHSVLDLSPQAMHLENILLHLANTMLVLLIGSAVFKNQAHKVELAFVAACLFSLHPLNVEAVAWISGRTDPLASFFALLALVCVYRFSGSTRLTWLWGAAILCLIGSLAKETALFCLPAAFLLACANDERLRNAFAKGCRKEVLARGISIILPFMIIGCFYLSLRVTTLRHVARNISAAGGNEVVGHNSFGMLNQFISALTTYGFYIKKLFMPLPLNFAITDIDGAYVWLGLAVALLVVWCLVRRLNSVAVQMMLSMLLIIASAFVISRAQIAWTPYAERYLYLPTAFFAIGVTDAAHRFCFNYVSRRVAIVGTFAVLMLMLTITAQRTAVWQNNLSLYRDTIVKSPNFGSISNELAIALTADNRLDEAMEQLEQGKKAGNQGDLVLLYVNQASILGEKKRYEDAYRALSYTYRGKTMASAHIEVIKSYINLMERERVYTKDARRSTILLPRLADLHELYYKRSGDTDHLYRAGQLALAAGNRAKAHGFFKEVADRAPNDSMYKQFARKMADKTGR